jgi:hypothetical protein
MNNLTDALLCNCGEAAVYAIDEDNDSWEDEFVCRYCIELLFPDGPDPCRCRPIQDTSLPDPSIETFHGIANLNHRSWWQRLVGGRK